MLAINFVYISTIILSIYVYVVSIKNHSSKISDIFILFMLVQMVVNISAIVLLPIESATLIEWFLAYKLRNAVLTFLPVIWLMFLHEYLKIECNKGIVIFFFGVSLVEFVSVLTEHFGTFSIEFFRDFEINSFSTFLEKYSPIYSLFVLLTIIAMTYAFALYYTAVKNRLVTLQWEIILITVLIQLMVISELFIVRQVLYSVDITLVFSLFATLAFYRLVVSNEIKSVIPISNSTILDNLPTPIIILNPKDIIVYANKKAVCEINSLKVGDKMSQIDGFVSVNTDDEIFNSDALTIKRKDGTTCTYLVHNEFYDGYAIIKLSNATEEKRKLEILNTLSSYDVLTNVLNKATFFNEASKRIINFDINNTKNKTKNDIEETLDTVVRVDSEKHKLYSVFMIDIDFFKKVNDTYGHQAGDNVLSKLAVKLQHHITSLGENNLVARFGGEEFCGFIEAYSEDEVILQLGKFRQEFGGLEFKGDNTTFSATLSIGVTFADSTDKSIETLLDNADTALYHAKNTGRNRLVVFSDELKS